MTTTVREIPIYAGFDLHAAQRLVWNCQQRFVMGIFGRRAGKTEVAKLILSRDGMPDGNRAAYMAPTNNMLQQCWRDMKSFLAPAIAEKSEQHHSLILKTGGLIEFWSLDNPDGPRGRSYDTVVMDECRLLPNADTWNYSVRPTLSDRRGRAYFFTTPNGWDWVYQFFQRGTKKGRERHPNWRSFQFPTSVNPHITAEEIESAREELPERVFRQEYLAEFLGDEGAVFRNVDVVSTLIEQEYPTPGHTYFFGVDFARSEDFSVTSVYDATAKQQVCIDRSNGIEYRLQLGRLRALAERFKPLAILAEDNSMGGPMVEELVAQGLPVVPFHTSNISKTLLVDALALALEREEIRLIDDEVQKGELKSYGPTTLPSGLVRYSAPSGMHDDTVMALMLSYYAAVNEMAGEAGYYRFA